MTYDAPSAILNRRLLLGLAAGLALTPALAEAQARRPWRERRQGNQGGAQSRQGNQGGAQSMPLPAGARTISFGSDPLQAYDLYPGPDTGPILMFVHGGGWARGERSMVNALPDYCSRHGFTLASTSYRLVPAVSAREEAEDVASAVASLKSTMPGRPVFLLGHSAGAHLAALVGVDPVYLGRTDWPPPTWPE